MFQRYKDPAPGLTDIPAKFALRCIGRQSSKEGVKSCPRANGDMGSITYPMT
jgi:hypothetical protein